MKSFARCSTILALLVSVGCQPAPNHGASGTATPVTETTTASNITMVSVPGGTFAMGYANGEEDERPVHEVTLAPFLIDKFEVTHAMFAAAQLPNPSHWQDDPELPVERVRWQDAKQYCNERSLLEGLEPCYDESAPGWPCDFAKNGYRLPTEAEWEYAARAGANGVYGDFGDSRLAEYAVFENNGDQRTAKVGSKKPNAWGIHDMYGNVSEWCHDVYETSYYDNSPSDNPHGPETDQEDALRVMRGGSWKSTASMCRATFRQGQRTGDTDACFYTDYCGFRCVRRP